MEESETVYKWKKIYTAVLIANIVYILFFYWITNSYA